MYADLEASCALPRPPCPHREHGAAAARWQCFGCGRRIPHLPGKGPQWVRHYYYYYYYYYDTPTYLPAYLTTYLTYLPTYLPSYLPTP